MPEECEFTLAEIVDGREVVVHALEEVVPRARRVQIALAEVVQLAETVVAARFEVARRCSCYDAAIDHSFEVT